ncbi:MAG TPA: putative porin, partial [Burkholderiales bacterium]
MISTRTIVAYSLMAAAMGSPSLALAEDTFQAEAGLSYSRFKTDSTRESTARVEGTYYFDKLPTLRDYPLDQARFVERIGSLAVNYGRSTFNIDNFDSLKDGSMYGANVDFRRPGTPLIVSAGYESFYSGKLRDSSFPFFETEADT